MALEGRFDERLAAKTISMLKDELGAIARRAQKPRLARVLAIDLAAVPPDPAQPTLEDFAQRFEPGFYSERELMALFAEEFPPSRRRTRRARLVAQQLEALAWLERVSVSDPALADPVSAWLTPALSQRLDGAGILTLRQLIDRVNGKGLRWYSGIAGLGAAKAGRILAWLTPHALAMGYPIGEHVGTPRRQLTLSPVRPEHRRTAIVPLEQLRVPAELDGSQGAFRAPAHLCLLKARTDLEAIQAWLRSKRSAHTVRAYRKEAERFLLWAVLVKQKPISSMTVEDCEDYRDFVADPQPSELWCGQRGRERWGPLWRPFNGPLNAVSERHAVTILRTLYAWLGTQGYLVGNPWMGVTPRVSSTPRIQVGRAFTRKQFEFIGEQIQRLPDTGANRRLAVVVTLLYITGMRREELVTRKVSDLSWQAFDDGSGGWMLTVLGKGSKLREVPVPDEIVAMIGEYLVARGLPSDPQHPRNREAMLIGRIDDATQRISGRAEPFEAGEGVTAGTVYEQLKRFLGACADRLATSSPADADRLRMASTHWLRHTHGTHAIAAGVAADVVQNNLGHASIATTGIYINTEKKRRHEQMQRLMRRA
jgi:site-specific recombinase XerD